jgi:hypothetical protein
MSSSESSLLGTSCHKSTQSSIAPLRLSFSIAYGAWDSVSNETFFLSHSLIMFYFLNNEAHDIYDGQDHRLVRGYIDS